MAVEVMYIYIYLTDMFIWLMFSFVTANTGPDFQWNVDTYDGRINLYLLQLCVWIIFCFIEIHDHRAQSWVSSKLHLLFILLSSNLYISNMYILYQNSRLPSHTICAVYLDYISPLIICCYFPLTMKTVGCLNIL